VLLFFYSLLLLVCWPLIAIRIIAKIGEGLARSFPNIFGQATTAILVILAGIIVFRWLWMNKISSLLGNRRSETKAVVDPANPWDLDSSKPSSEPWAKNFKNFVLIGLLGLIGFVLISPFPYRPGGAVQLLPPEQQLVQVPVSGQVISVNVEGGDGRFLEAGTIIASIASSELQNQVMNLQEQIRQQQAEVEKRRAELDKVQAGPRSEEVEIARREVATARQEVEEAQKMLEVARADAEIARQQLETSQVRLRYSLDQVGRLESLYDRGGYSLQQLDEARTQAEVSQGQVLEAEQALSRSTKQAETVRENLEIKQRQLESIQARLNLVLGGSRSEDIDIARQDVSAASAELNALRQSLVYTQGKLNQADLLMPIDGYLTTPYLKQKVGSYVSQGDTFATVQNNQTAIAQLELPEYDLGGLEVGAPAVVKLLAYPNDPLRGTVMVIEPVTTEETYGNVLNILISLSESTQNLKPGMAGYAKINAGEKPLIYLLLRPIIRFVQIELWSWLP
jgi:putative peptide zinc metalloprotease protein